MALICWHVYLFFLSMRSGYPLLHPVLNLCRMNRIRVHQSFKYADRLLYIEYDRVRAFLNQAAVQVRKLTSWIPVHILGFRSTSAERIVPCF